jgi:DNA-directed RNA polymerase subunit beta
MDVKILSGDEEEIEMRDTEDDDELQQVETLNIVPEQAFESEKVGSKE